jgi:hypothetical protein
MGLVEVTQGREAGVRFLNMEVRKKRFTGVRVIPPITEWS